MPEVAESLWSPEIKPTTQSPFAILDIQAKALTKQTNGILVGDLKVVNSPENKTTLYLDMVVPALNNFRHGVLTATYDRDAMYPVKVDAACFRQPRDTGTPQPLPFQTVNPGPLLQALGAKDVTVAASDEEFRQLVALVLSSDEVKSTAQSLIARANDVMTQREPTDNGKDPT